MRCVIQRARRGAVTINGGERKEIGQGLVVLVGVGPNDNERDVAYLSEKTANLRIFTDDAGKMNLSVQEVGTGECLVISQFTLYGDARKGRRPSFIDAAPPGIAVPLYELFIQQLRVYGLTVQTGEFGADMLVEIENDGPVTILLDSAKTF